MSNTNVQPESNKALDIGVVTLAVLIVAAGIFAFTFLTDQQLGIRIGALVGGLVIGCGVAAFSPSGKRFIGFCRESYDELRRVVWPTRRETVNTTGLVMAFVVAPSTCLLSTSSWSGAFTTDCCVCRSNLSGEA